jgi:uncharacterized protein GlcG (DUF336 family)
MTAIRLSQANAIADGALERGRQEKMAPLTVVVLDAGGHVVVVKREDGSGIARVEIATAKAWGALGMGLGTRNLAARATKAPAFYAALASITQGRIAPVPGGVLIRDRDGNVLGAVGISGDASDNDEICAIAGIEAASLIADPGAAE